MATNSQGKYIEAFTTEPLYLQGKAALLKESITWCRIILCKALQVFHGTCLSGLDGDYDIATDHENHDNSMLNWIHMKVMSTLTVM